MIKHIWSIVCKEAKVEVGTNNLCIIDVLENVQMILNTTKDELEAHKNQPILSPLSSQVVSLFYRDSKTGEETFEYVVKVLDPKSKELGSFNHKMLFAEGINRVRNIMKFDSMALTTSGTYTFQIFLREDNKLKQVNAIPLDVQFEIKTTK